MLDLRTRWHVHCGDNMDWLRTLPDNSVDAIVTDPPAGIGFMGKEWDGDKGGRDAWIAWLAGVMREGLRVLKPGGHALVWALPRTSHWTATACEDAGFEIRDRVTHLFLNGFPKSLDVSKAIDKTAGARREVVGTNNNISGRMRRSNAVPYGGNHVDESITAPATEAAKQWDGWGTALKPAAEDWWLCRKPLDGTVAANVLRWGTGAVNVDACRIGIDDAERATLDNRSGGQSSDNTGQWQGPGVARLVGETFKSHRAGRYPPHVILDAGAGALLDAMSGERAAGASTTGDEPSAPAVNVYSQRNRIGWESYADTGGASRMFYCAKESTALREIGCDDLPRKRAAELVDREADSAGMANPRAGAGRTSEGRGNSHPTVKPIDLMRYLCTLITPPGGIVLDMFAGSGTTGMGAMLAGLRFVGCELLEDHATIARARIAAAERGDVVIIEGKATKNPDAGPRQQTLFAEAP